MTNLYLPIFLGLILTALIFSCLRFYKEKQYRIMISFTLLGAIAAYYFKGLTEAKLALGGGIGVEGIFMAVTIFIIFLLDGVIGQFMSIYLNGNHSKNRKIVVAIGGIFIILYSLLMMINIL